MDWAAHTIWWQVYPLGFTQAPIRPVPAERQLAHRLRHLDGWLDYLIALGANGLALGPIFSAQTHGYDTTDFFSIDPRLGEDADFDALVAGCGERGIHVLLDGVFNHVGIEHPLFRAALAGGPDAPESELFRIDWTTRTSANFEGHESLVALNHDSDRVVDLVVEVMLHWLRRGIAGWRLDAAYAVAPSFWARVLPRVRAEFPDAWFVGEVIHGNYEQIVTESTMNSLTQYELWKAIWSSLRDENFFELDWTLTRHSELLDTFSPLTFVGNHDTTRIASQLEPAKAALAQVILFTVGGIPAVYYGDEQAFTGVKTDGWGGDDEVRPSFPGTPDELSPIGDWMFRLHQQLIGLRRRHPWLCRATTDHIALANTELTYESVGADGQRVRVELSLTPTPRAVVSTAGEEPLVVQHEG